MLYNPKTFFTHAALLDQACAHCPIFPTAASRRSLGRVSVPVWLIILSDQLTITALVGRYPTNKLIVRRLLPRRLAPLVLRHHAVLAAVSRGCPPPKDRYLRVTHPSAAPESHPPIARLACVKHAASVRSEPGSNSQVHLGTSQPQNEQTRTHGSLRHPTALATEQRSAFKAFVTHQKDTSTNAPHRSPNQQIQVIQPTQTRQPKHPIRQPHALTLSRPKDAANVSLPSLFILSKNPARSPKAPQTNGPSGSLALMRVNELPQTEKLILTALAMQALTHRRSSERRM